MNRWIVRLALAGLLAALAAYAWMRMNQDDDEDELEDEIPIEFDLPLESAPPTAPGETVASSNGRDTGVGPGADRQAAEHTGAAVAPAVTDQTRSDTAPADTTTASAGSSRATRSRGHAHDDLTIIRGIGPVFQKRLQEVGIRTFRQLADADPGKLEEAGIQGVGVDLQSWIEQAQALAADAQK